MYTAHFKGSVYKLKTEAKVINLIILGLMFISGAPWPPRQKKNNTYNFLVHFKYIKKKTNSIAFYFEFKIHYLNTIFNYLLGLQ